MDRFAPGSWTDFDIIDTMEIAKVKYKGLPSYSLESLCKHFGIYHNNKHSAKGDVLATVELYKFITQ